MLSTSSGQLAILRLEASMSMAMAEKPALRSGAGSVDSAAAAFARESMQTANAVETVISILATCCHHIQAAERTAESTATRSLRLDCHSSNHVYLAVVWTVTLVCAHPSIPVMLRGRWYLETWRQRRSISCQRQFLKQRLCWCRDDRGRPNGPSHRSSSCGCSCHTTGRNSSSCLGHASAGTACSKNCIAEAAQSWQIASKLACPHT